MEFGFHVPIAGGLQTAPEAARARGCASLQIFPSTPRGWKPSPRGAEEIAAFRAARTACGVRYAFLHAIYLLNLASPDELLRQRSIDGCCESLSLGDAIGADGVVVHLGSATDAATGAGLARLIESLRTILTRTTGSTPLLLENSAGGGNALGNSLAQLGEIVEGVGAGPARVGLCLDTCHAFAAGVDLTDAATREAWLTEVEMRGLLPRVRLLHLNDSAGPVNSRRDNHAGIGDGQIGAAALGALIRDPRLSHLPAILETPGRDIDADLRNLARVRALAAGATWPELPYAAPDTGATVVPPSTASRTPHASGRAPARTSRGKSPAVPSSSPLDVPAVASARRSTRSTLR